MTIQSPKSSIGIAFAAAMLIVAVFAIAATTAVRWFLPIDGSVAAGVRIGGETLPPGVSPHQHINTLASRLLDRTVVFRIDEDHESSVSLRDLGVRVDTEATLGRAMAVGRQGGMSRRLADVWNARDGNTNVPLSFSVDAGFVVEQVALAKEELDVASTPARYDFGAKAAVGSKEGLVLDAYGAVDSLYRAVVSGSERVDVPRMSVPPVVSEDFLARLDISQIVGHYETKFGYQGGQRDRAHNVATAAAKLDGLVMMPGQVVSFNQIVGHRTLGNGFRRAWEIFKGEMVMGVGGGTCQVASTLYAAAFLSGLDIVERYHHSRPSGYIGLGLDATVVDGLVDMKLRNPFPFPMVLRSTVDKGRITFEILGEYRPVRVTFEGRVVGTQNYKRKVVESSGLANGRVIRKQRGISGYTMHKVRWIRRSTGYERREATRDVYPPTPEILLVPPGTDPERDLPPLPHFAVMTSPDGGEDGDEERVLYRIEDAPTARSSTPAPNMNLVIER